MAAQRAARAPKELKAGGKRLWNRVLRDFELADHEESVLHQACRTVDILDRLQVLISDGELLMTSSQGARMHPAVVEFRQQTLTLAKCMASLRIPFGEEDAVPQNRSGVRAASLSAER